MNDILGLMRTSVTSDRFDARFGEWVCYSAAIVIFSAAVLKLCSLGLTEGQLMVGLLSASSCMLLMICMGMLISLRGREI